MSTSWHAFVLWISLVAHTMPLWCEILLLIIWLAVCIILWIGADRWEKTRHD